MPVIIQPNVTQPFEELLPYDDFSLRLQMEDVPRLGALLRGTSAAQVYPTLYLAYISPTSRLYLACISPVSRGTSAAQVRP